jgi:predicted nucleotidyltransferase/DNA-binding XRE family transcriptional regulator
MTLKEERIYKDLTQKKAAEMLGVSLRSYVSYENDPALEDTIKYKYFVHELARYNVIDETHGILSQKQITEACEKVFKDYDISYCYLFGSYAKWTAKETSDVDLLISTKTKGIKFFEMAERLREALQKKVDLLDTRQVLNNQSLLDEVLKYGIRIYG